MPLTALPTVTGEALPAGSDASPMRLHFIFLAETGGTTALVATFNDKPDNSGVSVQIRVPAGTSKEIYLGRLGIPLRAGLYVTYSGGTPAGTVHWE